MERYDIHNQVGGGTVNGMMAQAGVMNVYQNGSPAGPPQLGPWAQEVWNSRAWAAVEPYRQEAAVVAGRLHMLHDQAQRALAADPWQDPGCGLRFLRQAEVYLPPDLCPAEAALLLLVPLIHQVYQEETAVRHLGAGPTDLSQDPSATGDRLSYQRSLAEHGILLSRAQLRPEAREPIGWWLYRRWLLVERGDEGFPDLVDRIVPPGSLLREVLDQARLRKLLQGLRRGPDVCSGEHLDELKPEQTLRGGPGRQLVRERRLALLLALAHGMAIEMTALSDAIVEHIGIPEPVRPEQLRETLEQATWGGPEGLPVLDAIYHHGAVKEALGEHIVRLDELLHGIHRVIPDRVTHAMPQIPQRLSMEDVTASDPSIVDWVKFRLDERRVRDMLMGTQLYKDRNLAVRELYQNALDACRYREARTKYLRATGHPIQDYEGAISFVQGKDEDGRPYLECRDNGVGMGESQLRGEFSQAGARFADQSAYKLEEARWAAVAPPIELFPNSRFGIGVLSYFMLADEIRVTTCRMDQRTGLAGPVLEASIFGPGHLFKITKLAERGIESYTHVRLYFRGGVEGDQAQSCVSVLSSVLGLAEFTTRAEHGSRVEVWERGVLDIGRLTHAQGRTKVWEGAPAGVDIFWCEGKGALLVDGLMVEPPSSPNILSRGSIRPFGLVINLCARYAPAHISVDRTQVLDYLPSGIANLIGEAANALVIDAESFVSYNWLLSMVENSPRLADAIAEAAMASKVMIRHNGRDVDLASVGFFELDLELGPHFLSGDHDIRAHWCINLPDHIYLWRVLVYCPSLLLDELICLVPELSDVTGLLCALPSDRFLANEGRQTSGRLASFGAVSKPSNIYEYAELTGRSPYQAALRARALGVLELDPGGFANVKTRSFRQEIDVLNTVSEVGHSIVGKVEPADLVPLHRMLGVGLTEAADHLRRYGFDVPDESLPEHLLTEETLRILSRNQEVRPFGWLPAHLAVPPGHVAQAAMSLGIDRSEIVRRLEAFGRKVELASFPLELDLEKLRLLSENLDGRWPWLSSATVVPPGHLLYASEKLGISVEVVFETLSSLGFRLLPVPKSRIPRDKEILSGKTRHGRKAMVPDGSIEFYQLFDIIWQEGDSPGVIVRRLEAYGIVAGLRFPEEPRGLDKILLSRILHGDTWWYGMSVGQVVPYYNVLAVAGEVGVHPNDVVGRLTAYGITLSRSDPPDGLGLRQAMALAEGYHSAINYREGASSYSYSLPCLAAVARHARMSLVETAHWLRELGLDVPDVADLIRAALARVPREIPLVRP
ncbi:hypothetical protein [Kitasatospora sp. MY 5-36]|uniref:wHTH domain-containing protein n=1 Tax=Kitasatospora sp. MY 5-36 TaxID=1678027 RepID=UPI000671133A|nr:hypothetical protein [Kitasatospora sp. MY 5-36]